MYGLLTKLVQSRWLDIGKVLFLLTKKERGQYPAILTEQAWSIKRVVPSGLACEYSRLSFAPATTCETRRQMSAIHCQKFKSEIYQESFIGVVVDEVHCVTEWGSSSNNKIV